MFPLSFIMPYRETRQHSWADETAKRDG